MIRTLPALWVGLLLGACGTDGAKDSSHNPTASPLAGTTAAGTPPGTVTGSGTTTPTGTLTTGWEPTRYRVAYGWFGVQDNQATTVDDVDLFGTPITTPIQLAVRLADATIESGLTPTNHCDVVFTSTPTVGPATWTADAGWFAFEVPADALVSDSNCDFPLAAPWSDPGARVAAHRWGFALRPVDQADVDARGGYATDDPLLSKLLGATWWTSAPGGAVGGGVLEVPGIAVGNAIDPGGQLIRDANRQTTLLDPAAVPAPGGVVNGYYELTPLSAWRDASEL